MIIWPLVFLDPSDSFCFKPSAVNLVSTVVLLLRETMAETINDKPQVVIDWNYPLRRNKEQHFRPTEHSHCNECNSVFCKVRKKSFPSPIRRQILEATFPSAKEGVLFLTMCFAACGSAEKVTQWSSGLCVAVHVRGCFCVLPLHSFTCTPIHLALVSIATNVLHHGRDSGPLCSSEPLHCRIQIHLVI